MTDISSSTATGSLLRNLFAHYSPDDIFQITASKSDDEVASRYTYRYALGPSGSRLNLKQRFVRKRKDLEKQGILDQATLRALSEFAPQLVYVRVVEDLFRYSRLARGIAFEFDVPIAVHVMDDYEAPLRYSTSSFERMVLRRFLHWDLKRLFGASALNLAISESMCREFGRRYGCRFICIHNGVDPQEWSDARSNPDPSESYRDAGSPFRLLMAGSIDERKDADVIRRLARIVDGLNTSGEVNCELVLNVPRYYLAAAKSIADAHPNVIAQQYVPVGEYNSLLRSADCLVLARNDNEVSRAYTGLSFHNKLPEYLASGTPVLCIGPSWDSSVQFLKEHKAGIVLEGATDDQIREKIVEIARFPERFEGVSERARDTAFNQLDLIEIRRRFENGLKLAAFGAQTAK